MLASNAPIQGFYRDGPAKTPQNGSPVRWAPRFVLLWVDGELGSFEQATGVLRYSESQLGV